MSTSQTAEQRLQVSRALCLQALRQPVWLLLAQRVSAHSAHSSTKPAQAHSLSALLVHGLEAFLDQLDDTHIGQGQNDHPQQDGPR